MKVNAISALLLLFVASANGQQCKDLGIFDSDDCASECKGLANGKGSSSWSMNYDSDGNLTKCECTTSNKGSFTCTSERTPEPPVNTTEECSYIKTWDQCKSYCKSLSGNYSVSHRSRNGKLTQCSCDYGPNRQNNYTCTRERSSLRSS
ncbi:hypothetical protein QTG54_011882 [Skeletonema marinoi]|uniref:Uncharacterized protein n=1 Tax=Skeletonema marinoi TaxID=267567 RepID=A0AAD8Y2E2_9STRA|nr:hypothetical protein QTG54_011882 [Skeletonema marinoi]